MQRVQTLEAAVLRTLPDGFLRPKTDADVCGYLDGTHGVAYGVFDAAGLAAMGLLRIPTGPQASAAPPFPLVPAEDWPIRACFLEHGMVRPDARGRGHQRALLDARVRYAATTTMRWICGGVLLGNVVSWRNLLGAGMVIAGIRFDAGVPVIGLLRACDGTGLAASSADEVRVDVEDAAGHDGALRAGRVGVRIAADGTVRYRTHRPRVAPTTVRRIGVAGADRRLIAP